MNKKLNYEAPIKNFNDEEISYFVTNKLHLIVGQIMHFDDNIQIICYSKMNNIHLILKDYTAHAMIKTSSLTKEDIEFINEIAQRWQHFIFTKLGKPYLNSLRDYNKSNEENITLD